MEKQEVNIDQKEKSSSRRELRAARRVLHAESRVLCAALHHQLGKRLQPEPDLKAMTGEDWVRVLALAEIHEIRPAMYAWLKEEEGVPQEVLEQLKEDVSYNSLVQLANMRELVTLQKIMADRDIPFVAYKGLAFADAFCNSVHDRESIDLDIFTDAERLEEIREIMLERGYAEQEEQQRYPEGYFKKVAGEWSFEKYEYGERNYLVDVHWRPAMRHYHFDLNLNDLEKRLTGRDIAGQRIDSLDASGLLLLTLIHHGGIVFWHKLKYVQDLSQALENPGEIDWDWVLGYVRKFEFYSSFLVGLALAEEYAGADVPERFRADMGMPRILKMTDMVSKWYDRYPDRISQWDMQVFGWKYRLRSRDSMMKRLKMCFGLIGYALGYRTLARLYFRIFTFRRPVLEAALKNS